MVVFPNCKINLGLRVVGKRNDGYHDLDTVFYPLPFRDAAEIIELPATANEHQKTFELNVSGLPVPGETATNLCYKAWSLLKAHYPTLPDVKMYLHKSIPAGAGLGGGSSDGAFTLQLINDLFGLKIPQTDLLKFALELGSDCPFFILNRPCHATGRGEKMQEISLSLDQYQFVLVLPGIPVNTGWAFSEIAKKNEYTTRRDGKTTEVIAMQPIETWKEDLVNDFEEPVFNQYPALAKIKQQLYASGAIYASMTGTGSSLYALFPVSATRVLSELEGSCKIYYLNSQL